MQRLYFLIFIALFCGCATPEPSTQTPDGGSKKSTIELPHVKYSE